MYKEAFEMWKMVETNYDKKMVGNDTNDVKLMPLLQNILTSTDKVTLFATTTIIKDKNDIYYSLVA